VGFSAGFDAVVSRAMLPLDTLPNENNNTPLGPAADRSVALPLVVAVPPPKSNDKVPPESRPPNTSMLPPEATRAAARGRAYCSFDQKKILFFEQN
jgi:hypothetical protein